MFRICNHFINFILLALPYRPEWTKKLEQHPSGFSFSMSPSFREAQWHSDIPITYATLDQRPWSENMDPNGPYTSTNFTVTGKPPWIYNFRDLEPWTFIDFRVRFGNKYGVGNPSDWLHFYSDWARKFLIPIQNM